MRVAAVVGNPRPGGRTTMAAETVARRIAEIGQEPAVVQTVELSDLAARLFSAAAPDVDAVCESVATADAAVFASPTYKATFTGLLKAFLDRYPSRGLQGLVAVPLMLVGAPEHALAVEVHLRPVLVELGAILPTSGLVVLDHAMDRLDVMVDEWWDGARLPLSRLLANRPIR